MTMSFENKTILVTGAGGGLGREIALEFARRGGRTILSGRTVSKLVETRNLINAFGAKADVLEFDATDPASTGELFKRIAAEVGHIDIAINNAGIFSFNYVPDTPLEEFRAIFDTNLIGVFDCLRHELRIMRERRSGVIVNISSNMSLGLNIPGTAAYTASKAALDALTRVTAKEAIADGIRVFSINPGPLRTDMTKLPGESDDDRDHRWQSLIPIGRLGEVAEIAQSVLWACSGRSDYFVGERLVIDGGHSL